MTSTSPEWMLKRGEQSAPDSPELEERVFRGIRMRGWSGYVRIKDIEYWVGNRRTDFQITRLEHESREPLTNEQVIDALIGDDELDIRALAEDILFNELRTPLVLSYQQQLLDGNRRYLAHKWIEKNGEPHHRQKFSIAKVWVLSEESSSEENKTHVITDYNFLDDFRKEWTDFVKAKFLWELHNDQEITYDGLFSLYGGAGFTRNKIREFIKTYELIVMFLESASNEEKANEIAAENFIWFQQLQRSYTDVIRNDDEFRDVIYHNIEAGDIDNTNQLKNLKSMKDIREAWKLFRQGEVDRAHIVRQVVEQEEKQRSEPDMLMSEIIGRLERLLGLPDGIERVSDDSRTIFHELAHKVPGQIADADLRIGYTLEELDAITSNELATLNGEYLIEMEKVLSRVIRQIRSTRN